MEKINYKKVILITLLKIMLMIVVFFTINNWVHIKQSFNGNIPALDQWMNHALTPSNAIFIVLLSVIFYMNTLKQHRDLAEKQSKYTEI